MSLDPQVQTMLGWLPPHVDLRTVAVADLRAGYDEMVRLRRGDSWSPTPVAASSDLDVAGVACRLHLPPEPAADPPPLLVWLHGGGWVVGDLDSHEDICRLLCARSGLAVLQVGYRLAPEHPYPAGLQDCLAVVRDCLAVVREVGAGGRWASVSVGGDSAGGNLAAAVALVCRAAGRQLGCQVLAYPCLDISCSSASYAELADGFGLAASDMRFYWDCYAGPADRTDPLLSPAACTDLAGSAPAVVLSAQYDVLRDEGDNYAARLQEAGTTVWHRQVPGMVHGFLGQIAAVRAAAEVVDEMACVIRDLIT